jgi:hypothetical protein
MYFFVYFSKNLNPNFIKKTLQQNGGIINLSLERRLRCKYKFFLSLKIPLLIFSAAGNISSQGA